MPLTTLALCEICLISLSHLYRHKKQLHYIWWMAVVKLWYADVMFLFHQTNKPRRLDHLTESTRCSGHFLTKSCRMVQCVMSFNNHYEHILAVWKMMTAHRLVSVCGFYATKELSVDVLRIEGMAGGLSSADLAFALIECTDTIFSCWMEAQSRQMLMSEEWENAYAAGLPGTMALTIF